MTAHIRPKHSKFRVLWLALLLASQFSHAFAGAAPILSNPTWASGQFHFILNGETNVSYVIESSTDLRTWSVVLTNRDSQAMRSVSLTAPNNLGFWRVAAPRFQNAIAARGTVRLGGSGWVDSFDSADPAYSTDGQYDPAKRKGGGDVASCTNTSGAVDVGNMQVAGIVTIGPGGTVTVSPNGGVGDLAFLSNPAYDGMIQDGHVREETALSLPDARLPNTFGSPLQPPPGPGVIGGTAYTYVIGNGDYRIVSVGLGAGQSMIVTGRARLHVLGTTTVSGSASITIASNATVAWYAGGNVNIGGNGIVNVAPLANSVSIIGLSTCSSVVYTGASRFVGTIYAPSAAVSISGTADAIGAVVGRTFTLGGTMGLHYDEDLKHSGPFF